MNFLVAGLRFFARPLRRRRAQRGRVDFADMGTALGLDASTTLDTESIDALAGARAEPRDRLQLRLHRRSSF